MVREPALRTSSRCRLVWFIIDIRVLVVSCMWYANVNVLLCVINIRYVVNVNSVSKWGSLLSVCTNIHIIGIIHPPRPCVNDRDPTLVWPAMTRGPNVCVFVVVFVCFKADHIFYLNWPGLNFCGIYWDRRRVGLPTSRARARLRRLTPTDRYPKDSNPGPLDLKSSILPLRYRPPPPQMLVWRTGKVGWPRPHRPYDILHPRSKPSCCVLVAWTRVCGCSKALTILSGPQNLWPPDYRLSTFSFHRTVTTREKRLYVFVQGCGKNWLIRSEILQCIT